MAKKAVTKKAAKKSVKKTVAKKAPVKKAAKKTAAGKAPAKNNTSTATTSGASTPAQPVPKKAPAQPVEQTSATARVDVGFGNSLYIRGEGAGLSWDRGVLMENVSPYEWTWKTTRAKSDVEFKFLINDEIWAEGENLTVSPGGASISTPTFPW